MAFGDRSSCGKAQLALSVTKQDSGSGGQTCLALQPRHWDLANYHEGLPALVRTSV